MSLKETAIWDSRWAALSKAIDETLTYTPRSGAVDRQPTIVSLLRTLRDFGDKQYHFFGKGFNATPPWLTDSVAFSAEYAVRKTLDQIAFDLAAIERARNQRLHALTSDEARSALKKADILAYQALKPAIAAKIIDNTSVLTYFQKAPSVRIIPYANVALIGIPYTCQDAQANARDFLSIPHEVGHYVYWHGRKQGASIGATLRTTLNRPPQQPPPAWSLNWLEEIFSDVYGCLVAGPVIAYDFQELSLDNTDFIEDDGKHPIDAIRPYIYIHVLSEIQQSGTSFFQKAPGKLEANWISWLEKRDASDQILPKGADGPVTRDDAKKHMKTISKVAKDLLTESDDEVVANIWTKDNFDINKPYADFYDNVIAVLPENIAVAVPELVAADAAQAGTDITTDPVDATPGGIEPVTFRSGDTRGIWFNVLKVVETSGISIPPEVWSIVFTNGGWAAGGPENEGTPK